MFKYLFQEEVLTALTLAPQSPQIFYKYMLGMREGPQLNQLCMQNEYDAFLTSMPKSVTADIIFESWNGSNFFYLW